MLHSTETGASLPTAALSLNSGKQLVFTIAEISSRLGISRSHIYNLRKAGAIRFSKILGKTVITQQELDRFVRSLNEEVA